MTDKEALMTLNAVEGIGSVRIKRLLDSFGAPGRIFQAGFGDLTSTGAVTPEMARKILEAPKYFDATKEMRAAEKQGIRILTQADAEYPALLREIYDPPFVLYCLGDLLEADANAVGIVGSRGASYYGLLCARQFSEGLSRCGLTIVSGMARGIDTASHRAALDAGGRTIAVLGSGLNKVYPPENEGLFHEIAQKGAVLSEFPLSTPPLPRNFPVRNRIISGLSLGVLVVEASQRSGALITAHDALEQGRDVFAVPGKLSSETSAGANDLIKEGARMVTQPEEILEEIRPHLTRSAFAATQASLKRERDAGGSNPRQTKILARLSDEPKDLDVLSQETGLDAACLLSELLCLELSKVVKQLPGKMFVRAS